MNTAIVIGSTGLVGSNLVNQLINHSSFEKVILFSRRTSKIIHPKITEHVINFDKPELWKHLVKGDVLFSALGTTIKKAKSQDNQYKIDYSYQYQMAEIASKNDVSHYVLISSTGANEKSKVFYSRIKGELDQAVKQLSFSKTIIIKPSVLVGKRSEKRFGESLGILIGTIICKVAFLRKYRPIQASIVAKAMINASQSKSQGITSYELDEVFKLAENNV